MDTPLRLEFEMFDAEKERYYLRQAQWDAQMGAVGLWGAVVIVSAIGIVWALVESWTGGVLVLVFVLPLVLANILWRPTTERSLRQLKKSSAARLGLRFAQGLRIDADGVESVHRGMFGRARLEWNRVTRAERWPTYWYFDARWAQFIIPDRAFPSDEALAEFEKLVSEKIPPASWKGP